MTYLFMNRLRGSIFEIIEMFFGLFTAKARNDCFRSIINNVASEKLAHASVQAMGLGI